MTETNQRKRNKARKLLGDLGVELPEKLKERVTHRVKSKIGTLVVRERNGVVPTAASAIVRQFDENIGSDREKLADTITASGERLNDRDQALLALLTSKRSKQLSLARMVAEAGANPVRMMDLYTKGCVVLKKMEAIQLAAEGMPQVVKNLMGHAASEEGDLCPICAGTGEVGRRSNTQSAPASQVGCPNCKGVGKRLSASELKQFAQEKLLEINKLTEKGGGITQQVNVGVVGGGGVSILERVRKAADEALYRKPANEVVVEVVKEGGENG